MTLLGVHPNELATINKLKNDHKKLRQDYKGFFLIET